MNCPYCNRVIHAFTGLQELQKFQKHLQKCRKYPGNIRETIPAVPDNPPAAQAAQVVRSVRRPATFMDALEIRAESGQ